ncbi:MAG: MFS transporter [Legionellales bacterium]|nr:MFS transporter [Legionellales bacterium]
MKRNYLLGNITLLVINYYLPNYIIIPSLPNIKSEFLVSPFAAQLVLNAYFFGILLAFIFSPVLRKHMDKRGIAILGAVCFTAFSLLSTLTTNFTLLITARVLQAVGCGLPQSIIYSLIYEHTHAEKHLSSYSYLTSLSIISPVIAPLLGGMLILYNWRANFVMLFFLGLLSIACALKLPADHLTKNQTLTLFQTYKQLFSTTRLRLLLFILGFLSSSLSLFVVCGSYLMHYVLNYSNAELGLAFAIISLGNVIGIFNGKWIAIKKNSMYAIKIGLACSLFSSISVFIYSFYASNPYVVMGGLIFYMFGYGMTVANAINLTMSTGQLNINTTSSIISLVRTSFTALSGILFSMLAINSVFLFSLALLFISLASIILLILLNSRYVTRGEKNNVK